MNRTMPRPVLQAVAVLLVAVSLGAFTLGVVTAPSRGRLPGERLDGVTGQPIQAQDATPLVDERIQGAAPPVELTEEERAKLEADKLAKAEALALAKAEAEKGAPAGPAPISPVAAPSAPDKIGEVLEKGPAVAKPEEPLF
jgi:hypothetical protein